ncbi:MAG: T9SS type A sorting domain-containing protein [Bacteroidota bacterium]
MCKKVISQHTLLFLLLFTGISVQAQSWVPLGPDDFNQAFYHPVSWLSATSDQAGTIYTAAVNRTTDGKVFVRKFTDGQWTDVGNGPITEAVISNTEIEYSSSDEALYVAYQHGTMPFDSLLIKKFHQNEWIDFAPGIYTKLPGGYFDLNITSQGELYVAYFEFGNSTGSFNIKKLEGNNWVSITESNNPDFYNIHSFVLDHNDHPVVLDYHNYNNVDELFVKRFDGNNWETVGSSIDSISLICTDLAIDQNNNPVVAYRGWSTGSVKVVYYENSEWISIGDDSVLENIGDHKIAIKFNSENDLFLMAEEFPNSQRAAAFKYDWSSWSKISPTCLSYSNIANFDILFDEDAPIFYFTNNQWDLPHVGGIASFRKYHNNTWESVGARSLTNDLSRFISSTPNHDGGIYLMKEHLCEGGSKLWNFQNGSLIEIAHDSSLADPQKYIIRTDTTGVPYLVFNISSPKSGIVKKFENNQSWEVGNSMDITKEGHIFDMQFDKDNQLFVLYADIAINAPFEENYQMFLKKFNNGQWEYYNGFSSSIGRSNAGKMEISDNGTFYFLFNDLDLGKTVLKEFDGNELKITGDQSQFNGSSNSPDLTLDNNGHPITAWGKFINGNYTITVKKYQDNNWEDLTTDLDYFNIDNYSKIEIIVNENNEPLLAFEEKNGLFEWLAVHKLNASGEWAPLSSTPIASSYVREFSFGLNSDKQPYLVYTSDTGANSFGGANSGQVFAKVFDPTISSNNNNAATWRPAIIFPNPSGNFINIESGYYLKNFKILNNQGVILHQGHFTKNIDISALTAGLYFVLLEGFDGQMEIQKFMKL